MPKCPPYVKYMIFETCGCADPCDLSNKLKVLCGYETGTRREMMTHIRDRFTEWLIFNHTGNWEMEQIIKQSKLEWSTNAVFFSLDYVAVYTPENGVMAQCTNMQGAQPHIITLVFVLRRHAKLSVDGVESTLEKPVILEEEHFYVGDGHTGSIGVSADWTMTQFGVDDVMKGLKSRGLEESTRDGVCVASDGCGVQMKSRNCFMGMTLLARVHGIIMYWIYGGSGRFKWKHDAAGGGFKAAMSRFNIQRREEREEIPNLDAPGALPVPMKIIGTWKPQYNCTYMSRDSTTSLLRVSRLVHVKTH
jgi:hypothetical protein